MATILILASRPEEDVLPALALLTHEVRTIAAEPAQLVTAPTSDVILLDARTDLVSAKGLCKILQATGLSAPLILIVTEGGLAALSAEWGIADVILDTAGPAEIDARLRLALGRNASAGESENTISASGVVIDEASYSVRANDRQLDLTYKEFELLRFLATHPSRVFTREQLLSEVWGYDYFGGTRTVDVHVRRLRAKLGDMEQVIGTVRNVGYRFNVSDAARENTQTR
jgi:DNA-binding response OmpR family regulator